MIFVDSSVWVDYFNGIANPQTDLLDDALVRTRVVVGDIVLTEVLQGFRSDADHRKARRLMLALDVRSVGGANIALKAAENHRYLRSRGITISKTVDTIIATFCIESELPLLHADRDFLPFERHLGLKSAR